MTDSPLRGTRIVECTSELGVLAGTLLAALGAEVIRLEESRADPLRDRPPFSETTAGRVSLAERLYNSAKVVRQLPEDVDQRGTAIQQALAGADLVLLDELAPGGKELEAAIDSRAGVSVVSLHGFPEESPRDGSPFTDLILDAAGGQLYQNGFPGAAPAYPGGNQAYHLASLVAAAGALACLVATRAGRRGPRVRVNAQEAVALSTIEQANVNQWRWVGEVPTRLGASTRGHGGLVQTADGRWVIVNIPEGRRLLDWLAEEGIGPAFSAAWDDPAYWMEHYETIPPLIDLLAGRYAAEEFVARAQKHRLLSMPVNSVADLLADQHLGARGFFRREGSSVSYRLPWLATRRSAFSNVAIAEDGAGAPPTEVAQGSERGAANNATSLLAGLRVVEFCAGIAGPLTCRILANLGAEVIKVESETHPDVLRLVGLQPPGHASINTNGVFNDCNTGKLSIALNMKQPKAVEIARQLVARSDVVVTSFTPGVLARWGLDDDELVRLNPRLVVLSSSVMGLGGPHSGYRSYGSGITAAAGLSLVMGSPDEPPVGLGNYHSDYTGPYLSAIAILAALLGRQEAPGATFLDLSQLEGAVWLHDTEILEFAETGQAPERRGNRSRYFAPHGVFRCKGEDEWCAMAVRSDDEWRALREAIAADALRDPRFETVEGRRQWEDELERALEPWFRSQTKWEAAERLLASGVAASPVENNRDLAEADPGLQGLYAEIEHPEGPRFRVIAEPMLIDGARPPVRRAPLLGEQTEFVLGTLLGYDEEAVNNLYSEGAIG